MSMAEPCPLCPGGRLQPLREVDRVGYLRCDGCGTILAERAFLERTMAGEGRTYDDSYWAAELSSARERGYGASLIRLAEVFIYARRPVRRFLDVSCGAGTLLDAAGELMPEISGTFWGIEPFPPPPAHRARHPQYRIGYLRDLEGRFDGGTCIEVIEHLPPPVLVSMLADLATISEPSALWYFNSAQPEFVLRDDPGYLDPHRRGHIASYSVEGLRHLFTKAGFTLHPLPGRDWAFLAEYGEHPAQDANALLDRIWSMRAENRALLESARFGHFLLAAGREGARCYLEAAIGAWAVGEVQRQDSIGAVRASTVPMRTAMARARALARRLPAPVRRVARLARSALAPVTGHAPAPEPRSDGPEIYASVRSIGEWKDWSAKHAGLLTAATSQRIVEQALQHGLTTPLFGPVAASGVTLAGEDPRESLLASGLNSRLRAVLQVLAQEDEAHDTWNARIYAHEALTAFALLMRSRYPRFIGSEYAADEQGAQVIWPIPAVDITRSPFPDASFHFVLTNEVLEHVPDLEAALRDTARILVPGGRLIGTFPFDWGSPSTAIRARLTQGSIEHLHPPEYHGNPVDPEGGSLVFQIPGWDILDMCRQAGFADVRMVFTGSTRYGITGREIPGIFVLVARR
jgi:2-polyprenyl-3-methyl-5-hydroxy-6-metoxy-1,4-benzoquinol methylase